MTLTFALGLGHVAVIPITIIALISIGIALTVSPVVYQTVEKVQFTLVGIIAVFLVVAILAATSAGDWGSLVTQGVGDAIPHGSGGARLRPAFRRPRLRRVGGANNLVQSSYIRGMGMGANIPNIVSPLTGGEQAAPATGYMFEANEESMRRWRGWWRVVNQGQFITFFLLGVASLIVLSVLAYATLPIGQVEAEELDCIRVEGQTLTEQIAPWLGIAFWLAGTIVLFSTNFGIIDYTCRLIADQLKISALKESTFWSGSKIYATFIWVMIAVGSLILLSGIIESESPLVLTPIVISSSIAGLMVFVYSALLIWLNRAALPDPSRIRGIRLVMMVVSFLFFGFFSVPLIIDEATSVFGG